MRKNTKKKISRAGSARARQRATGSTASTFSDPPTLMTITIFREDDRRFAAAFESGDHSCTGTGNYSPTPFGALAELCSTLLRIAEDDKNWDGLFRGDDV